MTEKRILVKTSRSCEKSTLIGLPPLQYITIELTYTNHDGDWLSPSKMVKLDRFKCTKDNPWNKSKCLWAEHPDAKEGCINTGDIGIIRGKDYKGYKCPWCLHCWDEVWN